MRRLCFFAATTLLMIALYADAFACSVCKCGDQAFFITNARLLPRGTWIVSFENLYLNKSALQHEETHHDEHGAGLLKLRSALAPAHDEASEMQSLQQNSLHVVLNYGLTDRLMLMASMPYTFSRLSQGAENLRIDGFGDPEVMAMLHLGRLLNNSVDVAIRGGARLPLGQTDYTNDAGEVLHAHNQIGSGAYAGIFGLQLSHLAGSVPLFFSAGYQINGTNDQDFRYGNVFRFNFAAQRQLSGHLDLIAELNGRVADFDKQGGENDPNSGGTMLYFSPGLRFHFTSALAFRGQVQLPIVEELNGVQDEKTNVRASLIWML